jgi:hypothetical protein
LVKFELTQLDLSFHLACPVFRFLLAFKVIADGGVAFDADDSAPDISAVFVFAFKNRCHNSNQFFFLGLVGWRARSKFKLYFDIQTSSILLICSEMS